MNDNGAIDRVNPWTAATARIKRISGETPGVKTYDLEFVEPHLRREYRYEPGQFNMLYVPGLGEVAISICGRSEAGVLRHTIRNVGSVTSALDRSIVGSSLGIRGPFGSSWPVDQWMAPEPRVSHLVMVAGGIGLAPLRSVVAQLVRTSHFHGTIDLLIGARTPGDLLYAGHYTSWVESGIRVQTTVDRVDRQWHGHVGVVTLLLDRLDLPNPESTLLLTCGPDVMMRYVIQAAERRGIRPTNVWLALERHMNCAIGLCGHCQLGKSFLCTDGPVFRYDQIASSLRVQDL